MNQYDVGIIIVNYNCAQESVRCKNTLKETICDLTYKIYIVDNNSSIEDKVLFDGIEEETVEVIQAHKNGGYSYGNNIGIRKALHDGCNAILIINPDVMIMENSVEQLYETLIHDKNVMLVGPKIINKENKIDIYAQRFEEHTVSMSYLLKFPINKLNIGRKVTKYFKLKRDFDLDQEIYTSSGCCVMFSCEYFEIFGLFDEEFFMFSEEVIWGKNIRESSDKKALYIPKAVVIHDHPKKRLRTRPYIISNRMCSDILFCRKYLKCNRIKVFPLLIYYILSYFVFFVINKEFRSYLWNFINCIKKAYRRDIKVEVMREC